MPSWIGPVVAISLAVIALAYLAIMVAVFTTLKQTVSQATSLGKELAELRRDMAPTLKSLSELGHDGKEVALMAKDEIKEIIRTTRHLREDLERGMVRAKRRLSEFEDVVEVVQEEIEETALDVGAALRTARTGDGVVGKLRRLLVPPRSRRS